MRQIKFIFVHCTASNQKWEVKELLAEFKVKGWKNPGYHKVVTADGVIHQLLDISKVSNGVQGYNSTAIERDLGSEITKLWLDEHNLIIKYDLAIQLLQQLEIYSLKCFNVNAIHKKEVNSLFTIEEINSYDITKDYPDKLVINI